MNPLDQRKVVETVFAIYMQHGRGVLPRQIEAHTGLHRNTVRAALNQSWWSLREEQSNGGLKAYTPSPNVLRAYLLNLTRDVKLAAQRLVAGNEHAAKKILLEGLVNAGVKQ